MYYICVEEGQIVSMLNYNPNVPNSVTVTVISDDDYNKINQQTHYFDIATSTVLPQQQDKIERLEALEINKKHQQFLSSTDWQVLRHIRQEALGVPTSLSEAEYLDLELSRNQAAAQIIP